MTAATLPRVISLRPLLRVSQDDSGRERSNEEQLTDMVAAVDRSTEWVLSPQKPYRDVGSASRYAKKRREDFEALIADLRADTFTDDGLIIWESSRASRKVGEWVTLLDLLEERGKVVVVVTHGPRLYDARNSRDWRSLIDDAVDSEYESRKTHGRVKRSTLGSASAGAVPGGPRMFGYNAGGMTINEAERLILLEAVRKVLGGTTTRQIAKDWNARGIRTTAGNEWHPSVVRALLRNPRLAALRVHNGKVVGKGVWPQIIDEATHTRLAAVLAAVPRAPRGKSPWVLTGFLRCEVCGQRLVGNVDATARNTAGTRRYVCRKAVGYHGCGRVSIRAAETEALVGLLISERAADVDRRKRADSDDSAERAELNRIAAQRTELSEDYAAGVITRAQKNEDAAALDRRQRDIEALLATKVSKPAALDFVAAEGLIGRPWADLDTDEQRLVVGAFINTVTVGPPSVAYARQFERARVAGRTADNRRRIDWRV